VAVLELKAPLAFSPAPPIEPAYRVLATLPRGPVLEVPVYSARFASERTYYMLSSTAHWMPLVDAYSSYIPLDFVEKTGVLAQFPSLDAFRVLKQDRVRYVVFHLDRFSPEPLEDLHVRLREFAPYLQQRYADDRVRLYEIVEFPD
jgi:hypothetical protein